MARSRRTLALIIILPILATVITAFRVRDLPKAQDSWKLQNKNQQCDNCDVGGHKVHSDKIASDTHRDELKSTVRDKPLASQKLDGKSRVKHDVKSDEDDDDFDPKLQTRFRQEVPQINKLDKSVSNRKIKDADDNIKDSTKVISKPKLSETMKPNPNLTKKPLRRSTVDPKGTKHIQKKDDKDNSDDDDDDEDDEDDDDNDENDVGENYDGLENIEELFKILHLEKKTPSQPKQESKTVKTKVKNEPKSHNTIIFKIDMNDDDNDDDDEDDDDDDDDKDDEIAQKPISSKDTTMPKIEKEQVKKGHVSESKELKKQETESKEKSEHHKAIPTKHEENTKREAVDKLKPAENKKEDKEIDSKSQNIRKEKEKVSDKTKPIVNKDENLTKDNVIAEKLKPEPSKEKTGQEKIASKPKILEKDTLKKTQENDKSKEIKHDKKEEKQESSKEKNDYIKKVIDKKKESNWKDNSEEKTDKQDLSFKIRDKHSNEKLFDSEEVTTSHLKYVTEALHRRNLLKSEFEDFYSFFPTFAPNFSRIHNAECRRHGQIVLRQLRGAKLWALNMLDATAKIPSGVLQGNGIQLGDFDQCIGSRARVKLDTGSVVKVQGQYCLARIDLKAEHSELETPVYLAQAKSLIRSKIDDPGHFVPRFSTLSWGVCVPSACNPEDVEVVLRDAVKHYQHTSGLVVRVKVDEEDCYTDGDDAWEEWLELPTILTLSFYGVIVLLVLVATVQDYLARRPSEESQEETDEKSEFENKDEENEKNSSNGKSSASFLQSFSLYYTINKLFAPGSTDEIACIHGIRGIATLALLVAHKFLPVAVMPFTNRVRIAEIASSPIWSWCRAGWIFTDCFLLLSGVLTAHRIAGDGDSSAVRRLFSRYMRLTPALLAVVIFYAHVWDKLSVGPMWGTFVTKNAEVCQEGWWWNLLYIQNYFGFEDMCAPQTHQLALDMQLTILGGIAVWIVQSAQGVTKLVLPGIHLGAAYMRYATVRDHRLTLLAYHGVSVSQLYRTAKLSYMSTLHRCSPYLIGISLGLTLRKPENHGKVVLSLGWLTCGLLWAMVLWAGHDSGFTQYRYSATFAAQYAAMAPIASAMALAWVIYAVHNGTSEFLSNLLCWRPLVFISRLSYAMYLCQFIVFITNIGTVRTSTEFTLASLVDVQEILSIIITSTILTLTLIIPMQSLHKIFSFSFSLAPKVESQESVEEERVDSEFKAEIEEEPQLTNEETTEIEEPIRNKLNFLAHREVLEEIPEVEVEYEMQRDNNEGLGEILEEEEGTIADEEEEEDNIDDLEIIEEEEAGEEEVWLEEQGQRTNSRNDDQDLDEWEITTNENNGAQYYRYGR